MGEPILILTLVVIVTGGIGSIRGAFYGALIVGIVDTIGRAFLPALLREVLERRWPRRPGPAIASMLIYLLMAAVLALQAAGAVPGETWLGRCTPFAGRRCCVLLGAGAARCAGGVQPAVLRHAVHAHHDLCAGGVGPEPDPRLRRDGELRPRACTSASAPMRWASCRSTASATAGCTGGGAAWPARLVALLVGAICLRTSGMAFIMITLAFAQMLFFLAVSLKRIRRRRRHADRGAQRLRPGSTWPTGDTLYYADLRAAAGGAVRRCAAGPRALRHGAARLQEQRAAHGRARLSHAALQARGLCASRRWCACWPACCWPT